MDMKKKLLFVFNPCSGKAQIKNQLLDIVDTMVKADYEVTIYPTQCAGDAKEKVEAYAGNYDLVVCSGGDGTLALIDQLRHFPRADHDDGPDALEMLWRLASTGFVSMGDAYIRMPLEREWGDDGEDGSWGGERGPF